jgi:hypothetical protein
MIDTASDLNALWGARAVAYADAHLEMDKMVDVYDGKLPAEFADFFHDEMHVHVVNTIRLAWDDTAALAGKEFPIFVEPEGNDSGPKERAERLEKWAYGINRAGRAAGGVSMKALMKVLMWWLVGCANAVVMALPDFENQSPYFTFRDPRTHYPPVGWTPWNETKAVDALFAYQKSVSQLTAEYGDKADELRQSISKIYNLGPGGGTKAKPDDDETYVWVGEYYHEDSWIVATLADKSVTLVRSDQGDPGHPGVQPVTAMGLYSAGGAKGRSIYSDQISIQAAIARMFSQKLDFYDRTLYPIIFTTPLAGKTIKIGPYAVNEFDTMQQVNPRVDTVGPTNAMDADQTMQFAIGLSRILNRNPEQMQGAGEADSAKAIAELNKGVTATIKEGIWPSAVETLPTLYTSAAKMDLNLWNATTKRAKGVRKNSNFRITYRPRTLLKGHEYDFEVVPGPGLAGYQGTLEIMQLVQAELMSEDDALEMGDWAREPQEMKRRIQGDRMEKLMWATLNARAAQPPGTPGVLKAGAMGKLRRMVNAEDMDLFDAVEKLETTGELYEEAPPPGMDPLAALMGGGGGAGGGPPMLPPPQIGALARGA